MAKGVAKKVKDPNAPKRALTAYFLWLQENREKIKQPGMSATAVAKAAGEAWRSLPDKSKWEKKAEEDKKRYDREIAAYKGQ